MKTELVNSHYPVLADGTELTVEVVSVVEDAACTSEAGNQTVTEKWQEVSYESITITDSPHPNQVGHVIWCSDPPASSLEDELLTMMADGKFNPLNM